MKPWKSWLYGLGFAATCFTVAGCGGGDVPDASDEGQASAEAGPSEPSLPSAAPAAPAAPNPAAAQAGGQAPAAAPAAEDAPEAAPAEAAPAKSEANSATAEMLAIATGGNSSNAEAEGAAGQGGQGGPGGMMGPMGMMRPPGAGGPGQSQMQMMNRMGPQGYGAPTNVGAGSAADMSKMAANMMAQNNRAMMGQPGGMRPGGPGGPGMGYPGAGGKSEAGDTTSPDGAVKAFLSALKDKDRERLTEATALRASTAEEGGKYRDMFGRIIDSSISDSELDDLASKLEGYSVSGENQAKSTGKLGVILKKSTDDGGWLSRTVTVRKEKKGWGVLDISTPPIEFHGNGFRRNAPGTPGKR